MPRSALITTTGFRDSLEIARGNRPDFFNLAYRKPAPFVPRYLRREIPGRMTYLARGARAARSGRPSRRSSRTSARQVEAIAVCLLHSYANPSHELRVGRGSAAAVAARSRSSPHTRSRANGVNTSAPTPRFCPPMCSPLPNVICDGLNNGLRSVASRASCTSCSPTAASTPLERSSAVPITMVESGPASGFWGAAELGRLIGVPNVLALDIGGTTAKCSLDRGRPGQDHDRLLDRAQLAVGRLSHHGPGGRSGGDRQRRRQHCLDR